MILSFPEQRFSNTHIAISSHCQQFTTALPPNPSPHHRLHIWPIRGRLFDVIEDDPLENTTTADPPGRTSISPPRTQPHIRRQEEGEGVMTRPGIAEPVELGQIADVEDASCIHAAATHVALNRRAAAANGKQQHHSSHTVTNTLRSRGRG